MVFSDQNEGHTLRIVAEDYGILLEATKDIFFLQ